MGRILQGLRSYSSAYLVISLTAGNFDESQSALRAAGAAIGSQGDSRCRCPFTHRRSPTPLRFAAETSGNYEKVEFHDGHRIVGTATKAPWQVEGVKLDRGLHALFAVGVTAEGTRKASRPAFLVVE